MLKNNFDWHDNWDKIEELYDKLTVIIEQKKHFQSIKEFNDNEDFEEIFTCQSRIITGYAEKECSLARAFNRLIAQYVMDEES